MRLVTTAVCAAALALPALASAQTAPMAPAATATSVGAAKHYTTADTEIGTLLDDPAARAVLDKRIPGMTGNEQLDMARSMTLKGIQQYSPDTITDKLLADVDADLAKIPVK